jgi:hypothetical protein
MTESYTPNQFINKINQDNPNSPTFDPLGTHELRQRIENNKIQSGNILAQAEQQVLADEQRKQQEYLNSLEAKIAKAEQEIQDMKAWLLTDQTYTPETVDSIIDELTVEYDPELDKAIVQGNIDLQDLTSARGLHLPQRVGGDLILRGLTSAKGLQLPQSVGGSLWLRGLTSAKGLQLPQSVGGGLDLRGLTSAKGLQLPQSVGGDLGLYSLTSAEGLQLPDTVGGDLDLYSLTSAKGLQLPESVGGVLWLRSLTSAEGLQLPETVGGKIYLNALFFSDIQKLRELRPDLADKIR